MTIKVIATFSKESFNKSNDDSTMNIRQKPYNNNKQNCKNKTPIYWIMWYVIWIRIPWPLFPWVWGTSCCRRVSGWQTDWWPDRLCRVGHIVDAGPLTLGWWTSRRRSSQLSEGESAERTWFAKVSLNYIIVVDK